MLKFNELPFYNVVDVRWFVSFFFFFYFNKTKYMMVTRFVFYKRTIRMEISLLHNIFSQSLSLIEKKIVYLNHRMLNHSHVIEEYDDGLHKNLCIPCF